MRSVREVIAESTRKNRVWEWVCFALTVTFAVVGVGLIVTGAVRDDWGIAGPGVGTAALLGPTLWAAIKIWRTNIRIHLLEVPLSLATTADEAARIINEVFLGRAGGRRSDGAP
ncbi:MAG: hypothetical protein J0I06_20025 [Planctomycetes bacterium]|nr:hypothetical protein [Planctomycetota bacterium]